MVQAELYPWYSVANGPELEQGDVLVDVPVPVINATSEDEVSNEGFLPGRIDTFDLIVMTQSCDIPKNSVKHLILCPIWTLNEAANINSEFGTPGGRNNLRLGRVFAYHLLNKCELEGYERDHVIVGFERIIERPKDTMIRFAEAQGDRIRLMPPYREHLAQAFARFFMRIGLPIDIPAF